MVHPSKILNYMSVGDENGDGTARDGNKVVETLHHEAQASILEVADIIEHNGEIQMYSDMPVDEIPRIPECKLDFELGDMVKIKCSTVKELESILTRTTGWTDYYGLLLGLTGYVTKTSYGMGTNVAVRYPEVKFVAFLYPGVLEKVQVQVRSETVSGYKVNDIVSVRMDAKPAAILQSSFSGLKPDVFRKNGDTVKGKVIRLFSDTVLVTFNGLEAFSIHPGLLKLEDERGFKYAVYKGRFEFESGVMVTANIPELFKRNKAFEIWNRNVSIIAGRKVFYLGQCNEEYGVVCTGRNGPTWYMHINAMYAIGEKDPYEVSGEKKNQGENESKDNIEDEKCMFMPEEAVKLKKIDSIRKILKERDIPLAFLEYLQVPFKVISYREENLNPNVKIHSNCFTIDSKLLEKLTDEEKEWSKTWSKMHLHVGKIIHLDVGPPNYVKKVLEAYKLSNDVIQAMTTSAKVVGFVGHHDVVIEYPNEKKYKIHKRYLTDPKKFNLGDENKLKYKVLVKIQCEFMDSLEKGMLDIDYDDVSILPKMGHPPTLIVKLFSLTAIVEDVLTALSKANIKSKALAKGVIVIGGLNCYSGAVNVEIEVVDDRFTDVEKSSREQEEKMEEKDTITEPISLHSERPSVDAKAIPITDGNVVSEQQYAILFLPLGNAGQIPIGNTIQNIGQRLASTTIIRPPEDDAIAQFLPQEVFADGR